MSDAGDAPRTGEPVAADVAGGVRAIVAEAERFAETIRQDAERRAEQRLRGVEEEVRRSLEDARRESEALLVAQQRRAKLAEQVVERSEAISTELAAVRQAQRELNKALDSLGAAVERMSRMEGDGYDTSRESAARSADPEAPERGLLAARDESPVGARPPRDERVRRVGGARLVAAQMALAGSSRAEVAAHLQRTFEVPALHEILDEVFSQQAGTTAPHRAPTTD